MQNNQNSWQSPDRRQEPENQRVGRELYHRDQRREQQEHRERPAQNSWDNGNNFHVGYSHQNRSHFPEDTHQRTSNADRGGSLGKHYGDREYSTYRNPNNLNYGDGRGHSSRTRFEDNQHQGGSHTSHFSPYGDGRGNYSARQDSYGHGSDHIRTDDHSSGQRRRDDSNENYYRGAYMDPRGVRSELPNPDSNPYTEYPGSRSRYKDDDYRYGSGNHGWYQERRYTDNDGHRRDRDKGAILGEMGDGIKEAWHDMKHGAQNMWHKSTGRDHDRHDSDYRGGNRHDYEYRSRRDQGYERGPRWSDETDTGDDSFFYSGHRTPRYY